MIAATFGPYCTGASTPAGASAVVTVPHPHRRLIKWCSVTRTRMAGTSNT